MRPSPDDVTGAGWVRQDPWSCSSALESASREDLLTLIGLLQRQVAAAEARAEAAEARAAELAVANEWLTARVAELEQRLGRNSGNSSMPPSSDVFGRPEKKPQPKSGRKRGRQPGTDGSGLAMTDKPDATEDHVPAACTGCGTGSGRQRRLRAARSGTSPCPR